MIKDNRCVATTVVEQACWVFETVAVTFHFSPFRFFSFFFPFFFPFFGLFSFFFPFFFLLLFFFSCFVLFPFVFFSSLISLWLSCN